VFSKSSVSAAAEGCPRQNRGPSAVLPSWIKRQQEAANASAVTPVAQPGRHLPEEPWDSAAGAWGSFAPFQRKAAADPLQAPNHSALGQAELLLSSLGRGLPPEAMAPRPGSLAEAAMDTLLNATCGRNGLREVPNVRPAPECLREMAPRMRGRLRAFNPEKGFGFIACDDSPNDLFIRANRFSGPTKPEKCESSAEPVGQEVEFTVLVKPDSRTQAVDAVIVGPALPPKPTAPPAPRFRGRLRSFWPEKGKEYGFIACEALGGDVFVHGSAFADGAPQEEIGKRIGTFGQSYCGPVVEFSYNTRGTRPRAEDAVILEEPSREVLEEANAWGWKRPSMPMEHREVNAAAGGVQATTEREAAAALAAKASLQRPAPASGQAGSNLTEALAEAMVEVLQHKEKLEYSCRGYNELGEVLGQEPIVRVFQQLTNFDVSAIGPLSCLPAQILDEVQAVVRSVCLPDGQPCFELWDDRGKGFWLRMEDLPASFKIRDTSSSKSQLANQMPNFYDVPTTDMLRQGIGGNCFDQPAPQEAARAESAVSAQAGRPSVPQTEANDDETPWWMGDGPGATLREEYVPPFMEAPVVDDVSSWFTSAVPKEKPAPKNPWKHASSEDPLAGEDPWLKADPWAGSGGKLMQPVDHDSGDADGRESNDFGHMSGNGHAGICNDQELSARSELRSDGPAEGDRQLADDEERLSADEILAFLRKLPHDAPRGVREYLASWARLEAARG